MLTRRQRRSRPPSPATSRRRSKATQIDDTDPLNAPRRDQHDRPPTGRSGTRHADPADSCRQAGASGTASRPMLATTTVPIDADEVRRGRPATRVFLKIVIGLCAGGIIVAVERAGDSVAKTRSSHRRVMASARLALIIAIHPRSGEVRSEPDVWPGMRRVRLSMWASLLGHRSPVAEIVVTASTSSAWGQSPGVTMGLNPGLDHP